MDKLLTIEQVSKALSVSKETLRVWDRNGFFSSIKTRGGHRRWRESDVNLYIGSSKEENVPINLICIYGRVSSHDQKKNGDLDRQCQRLSEYCSKKKYKVGYLVKDVGSGLSDSRKGLVQLFNLVISNKISKLVIEHKDRLTRFQYKFFEFFFNSYNIEIEIVENKILNNNEELVEDIMMLMASFSGKLYGRRSADRRKKNENNQINQV